MASVGVLATATVNLASLLVGPETNWAVTATATETDTAHFSTPGFSVSAANMSGGSNTTGQVLYSYSMPNAGSFAPNGNLLNVADSVTGAWTYTYDNLNRLVGAAAVASALQGMENYYAGLQTGFGYDAFGNRTVMTQGGTPAHSVPSSSTAYYTASSNQVASMTYDAAGDVIYDGLNSYLYDAEGRLCAVRNYVGVLTGYLYDAAGTRVAKGSLATFSCNFAPTNFTPATSWVLGPGGEQVTEYAVSGGASAWAHTNAFSAGQLQATYHDTGTYFYLGDWLATKRVEVGASGCISAYAGLPFGDGLTPVSVRGYASCVDATEHHFTGKERDTESGNDYFEARYYASSMGRFMSPDPVFGTIERVADPQQWNMYAYARNNPLTNTDPTGLDFNITGCGKTSARCQNNIFGTTSTDANGKSSFTATILSNGKDGGLVDQNGNKYSGTFNDSGFHFSSADGKVSGGGQFVHNSAETDLNGSGVFSGVQGKFVSDCGGSCQGRGSLYETQPGAFNAMEGSLNKQGGLTTALDLLSGAHNAGTQWKDLDGYIHVILNGAGTLNAGKMEMHFEGNATGVDLVHTGLHLFDTIHDRMSGAASNEKNRVLP